MQKHPKNHQIGAPILHRQRISSNHLSRLSHTSLHFQSSHLVNKMINPIIEDTMDSNQPKTPPLAVTTNLSSNLQHPLDGLDNSDGLHNASEVSGLHPNPARTPSIKIINLCAELKSYDEHDDGNYVTNVVSGFNTKLLFKN